MLDDMIITGSSTRALEIREKDAEAHLIHTLAEEAHEWELLHAQHSKNAMLRLRRNGLVRGFLALARRYYGSCAARAMLYTHNEVLLKRWRMRTQQGLRAIRMSGLTKHVAVAIFKLELRRAWSSLADTRVFQNQQRAVQAVQQSTRRRALNSWVATREARRRRTEALEGALRLWQRCCCGRAWRTWRTMCADRATLAGALRNLNHRASRAALNAWRKMLELRAEMMRRIHKGGVAIKMRALRACANTWREVATVRKEHLRLLRSGASAFATSQLRRASNTWAANVQASHALSCRRAASVGALANMAVRRAINTWRIFSGALADANRKLRAAATTILDRQVRRGWNQWWPLAVQRRVLKVAMHGLVNRALCSGLNAWREFSLARTATLSLMKSCVAAIANINLRRGTNTWRSFARVSNEANRKLRAAATTILDRQVRRGWNQWWPLAVQRRVLKVAMHGLVNRALCSGLNAWREFSLARTATLSLMKSCVAAIANINLRRGTNTWRSFARVSNEAMRLLRQHASAVFNRKLWRIFHVWFEVKTALRESLRLLDKAARGVLRSQARRATNTWSAFVRERLTAIRRVEACVRALRFRDQARGLRQWRSMCRERARHQTLFRMLQGSSSRRERFGAFQLWVRALRAAHSLNVWHCLAGLRALMKLRKSINVWLVSWLSHVQASQSQDTASLQDRLAAAEVDVGDTALQVATARGEAEQAVWKVDEVSRHFNEKLYNLMVQLAETQECQRIAEAHAAEADARLAELSSSRARRGSPPVRETSVEAASAVAEYAALAPHPSESQSDTQPVFTESAEGLVPMALIQVSPEMAPRLRSAHIHLVDEDGEGNDRPWTAPTASKKRKAHKRRTRSKSSVGAEARTPRRLTELTSLQTPGAWVPANGPLDTRWGWHGPAEGARHVRVAKRPLVLRTPRVQISHSLSPARGRGVVPFGHLAHEAWVPAPAELVPERRIEVLQLQKKRVKGQKTK